MCHKRFPQYYFALKIADIKKVQNMKRDADIMMEKHALNKLKAADSPVVQLIGTFKDDFQLYFLTEMLKSKDELWAQCRTFGLLQSSLSRHVFK